MNLKSSLVSILFMFFTAAAGAAPVYHGYLETAGEAFHVIPDMQYGLEVEMMNIGMEEAAAVIMKRVGGRAERKDAKTIRIHDSAIGEWLDVKLEVNETSDDPDMKWDPASVIEVVSSPIHFDKAIIYAEAIKDLKNAGAVGTEGKNPISIQVNIGFTKGSPDEKVAKILRIVRNYFSAEHQTQIMQNLEIPAERLPYLRPYSEGLMKQLLNPDYKPTAAEFYFDFFYRQSLENAMKGNKAAWTMSEREVRQRIEALKYPIDVVVIKLNQIKIASLLMNLFPNDPYSIAAAKQGWIKGDPLIEFRNANNNFDVLEQVKQTTGILILSEELGVYSNDKLVSQTLGIPAEKLRRIRAVEAQRFIKNKMSCDGFLQAQ